MNLPSKRPPPDSLPRNVKLLGWASFLNDVASEMIYPLMPQFLITVLGGNRLHLGIIEGVAESSASLLKLWSGWWSDRVGSRKGFVIWGYAIAALVRPITGLLMAPWQLFLARVSDRVGKGIRTSPRDALIAASTVEGTRGRAFGFQRAMDHLGAAVGPLLAAIFLWWWPSNLRVLFGLTLIPGLCVVGLLLFGLREATQTGEQKAGSNESIDLAPGARTSSHRRFDGNFRLYLLAVFIFTLGNSSDAFLLVRAGELGVPTFMLPVLWFAFHLVKSSVSLLAGRVVDRRGAKLPLCAGWFIYATVYIAFAFASAAWHAWILFLAYGLFYALSEPAEKTLVARLAGPRQHGLAFGWFNFAIGISALPSSLIFGLLYETYGAFLAFGYGAGLALVAVALLAKVSTDVAF